MRKGIRNFCNGDASTSTLNQHKANTPDDDCRGGGFLPPSVNTSPYIIHNGGDTGPRSSSPTLEQMILQLEIEEEIARKAKLNDYVGMRGGRMSCVNNSDILRSARNALNQYPRFSLDGKDAMYRSSFRNLDSVANPGRKSVCCDRGVRERMSRNDFCTKFERKLRLPTTLAGESVVWCKPGAIGKLMGLEAMPVPINSRESKEAFASVVKRQNLRRRVERHEMERRVAVDTSDFDGIKKGRMPSCSKTGYCAMKPAAVESAANVGGGWPTRRFR